MIYKKYKQGKQLLSTGGIMKRFSILACALMIGLSSPAWAECKEGFVITGNNNVQFCFSNTTMNWWSAFAWCKAQNMELATFEQICAGQENLVLNKDDQCSNIQRKTGWDSSSKWTWLGRAWNTEYALRMNGWGWIESKKRTDTASRAVCVASGN